MKKVLLPIAILTLPFGGGCSDQESPAKATAETGQEDMAAKPEAADGEFQLASSVDGIVVRRLSVLPKFVAAAGADGMCENYVVEPRTAAGKRVSAAGWSVTGEARIGGVDVVSFAGSFEPGTSGMCEVGQGNLAIFDEKGLVALAYTPSSSSKSIGKVLPFENKGLRIWDGDLGSQPVADIRLDGNKMAIVALAAEEKFCGGKSVVPNIYGVPISKARKQLRAKGWDAVPNREAADRTDSREAALASMDITEVASCSGTGYAFCAFDYTRPEAGLNVSTIGDDEDPPVFGYDVRCEE